MKTINIPTMSKGKIVYIKVDDIDFPKVTKYRWTINSGGYAMARDATGHMILLARYLMGFPVGKEIDHINRNKLDNRRTNLRLCNRKENVRNTVRGNPLKYRGVHKRSQNSYRTHISVDGKKILVGGFKTAEEAALEYNRLARKHHKEFAILNDI